MSDDRYKPKKLLSNIDFTVSNIFKFKPQKKSVYNQTKDWGRNR